MSDNLIISIIKQSSWMVRAIEWGDVEVPDQVWDSAYCARCDVRPAGRAVITALSTRS